MTDKPTQRKSRFMRRWVNLISDGTTVQYLEMPDPDGPVESIGRLSKEFEEKGETLRVGDVSQAKLLAEQWGVPTPKPGTYFPKDGAAFLIAVWAQYRRGSRFWAESSEDRAIAEIEKKAQGVPKV